MPLAVTLYMDHHYLPVPYCLEAQQWDFAVRWVSLKQACESGIEANGSTGKNTTAVKSFRVLCGFYLGFYLFAF